MKNKKFKLFASLTSLVMVVAVMAVGVWAATSASATINGKVSFDVTGVQGSISILKQGTTATVDGMGESTSKQLVAFDLSTTNEDATGSANITYEFVEGAETKDGLITGDEAKFTVVVQIVNSGTFAMTYEITIANQEVATNVVTAAASATGGTWDSNKLTGEIAAKGQADTTLDVTITYTLNQHNGQAISGDTNNIPEVSIKLDKKA